MVVEVDYAPDAEPYTGSAGALGDTWSLFQNNAAALFADPDKRLEIPSDLSQMQQVDVVGENFSAEEILTAAGQHRNLRSIGELATFYVLWLDGYFRDDAGERRNVLGVSLGDTGVVAMFKPVIASARSLVTPYLENFVEQSTLVHEFGHAVGLVNNGIPLASAHHDAAHGAHCADESCVMFYANEGVNDARDFALKYIRSGNTVLYGDECLGDVAGVRQ